MKSNIDISIVIPTYNRLWCLPKAINSCRNTKCITEIIVIDDGSTDGTWEWLKNQTGITALKQENWGKCWAVNYGFKVTSGKYIKFLDSDDIIDKNAIDEQFLLAEQSSADLIVSGYRLIDEQENIIKTQKWVECDDFIAQQLGECDSSHYSSYLFKKEFINEIRHRPDFAFRDDRLFVIEVALKKPKVAIHYGFALLHRMHTKERLQHTFATNKYIQDIQHLNIYRKIIMILDDTRELNTRRIVASTNILWPLAHWIAMHNLKEAVNLVEWIYQLNPNFKIPHKGLLGFCYNYIGFKNTEHLLNLRRIFTKF